MIPPSSFNSSSTPSQWPQESSLSKNSVPTSLRTASTFSSTKRVCNLSCQPILEVPFLTNVFQQSTMSQNSWTRYVASNSPCSLCSRHCTTTNSVLTASWWRRGHSRRGWYVALLISNPPLALTRPILFPATGQDATEAFEDVGHSDEARALLPGMLIGDFEQDSVRVPCSSITRAILVPFLNRSNRVLNSSQVLQLLRQAV